MYNKHKVDSMNKKNYVYWYHLIEHTDVFTQGYIGITNDLDSRHNDHIYATNNGSNLHFHNAIRKYSINNIVKEVVFEGTREEVEEMEFVYRPDLNIGWNMNAGGSDIGVFQGKSIELYNIKDPTTTVSFSTITEAETALGYSKGAFRTRISRKAQYYDNNGWAIVIDTSLNRSDTLTTIQRKSNALTGIKRTKPSHFKGKSRWTEEDKLRIGAQHKGKTISNKQKDIVRTKNRASHTSCSPITLIHKDDTKAEHSYHSISEASRCLGIPLPRLKSKVQRPLGNYGKDGWAVTKYTSNKTT